MSTDLNSRPGLAQRVRRRAAGHWSDIRGLPRPQPLTASLKSKSAGLDLPREFPVKAYDELQTLVMDRLAASPALQREFNGAWNAVAYRFLAAAELDMSLSRSIKKFGATPEVAERYRQERDLFAFFGNACSVLDSLAYALYALNADRHPNEFPLTTRDDRQNVGFFPTKDLYRTWFPDQAITRQLVLVASSEEYNEIRRLRSVLVSRSSDSRNVHEGGESGSSHDADDAHLDDGTELKPDLTARSRAWVAETLRALVPAALEFARDDPPEATPSPGLPVNGIAARQSSPRASRSSGSAS
jgi:hypothetical protein